MEHGTLTFASDPGRPLLEVERTSTAFERLRGLLGRPAPAAGRGLLIDPCASVHTTFMSYPIDVVFIAGDWTLLRVVPQLRPWRAAICPRAAMTLELAAGQAAALGISAGQRLLWRPASSMG